MTKHPSANAILVSDIILDYGAQDFRPELMKFIANTNFPNLAPAQLRNTARNIILPFQHLPLFHKIKFWILDPQGHANIPENLDTVHARPRQLDKTQEVWSMGWFDTVLVNVSNICVDNVDTLHSHGIIYYFYYTDIH
jgi:hypothetical protein